MRKTVLVTGSQGFVGKQVLRALGKENVSIRLVLREGRKIPEDQSTRVEKIIYSADMFAESSDWWATACEGVDTIIHVAWYAVPGQYLQSPKNLDCLLGTLRMAKGAVRAGVRRFTGVGTCFEYDLNGGLLSTDTCLKPLTPYAGAKAAAFLSLSHSLPAEGVEFAWCRLFYLYGEGEDERRLVPYVRNQLAAGEVVELTSGNQIRDYLDVKDAGNMLIQTALGDAQGAVNICSGIPITVRQLVENIADEYGRRDLLKFGVRQENLVDPACVVGVISESLI